MKLFKKTFRFTGGEIVGEFLMSIGYLPGAHVPNCPVYQRDSRAAPLPWVQRTMRWMTLWWLPSLACSLWTTL